LPPPQLWQHQATAAVLRVLQTLSVVLAVRPPIPQEPLSTLEETVVARRTPATPQEVVLARLVRLGQV
jgi:hypothetical protein